MNISPINKVSESTRLAADSLLADSLLKRLRQIAEALSIADLDLMTHVTMSDKILEKLRQSENNWLHKVAADSYTNFLKNELEYIKEVFYENSRENPLGKKDFQVFMTDLRVVISEKLRLERDIRDVRRENEGLRQDYEALSAETTRLRQERDRLQRDLDEMVAKYVPKPRFWPFRG